MTLTAVAELQVCRDCGEAFGTDEAKRCLYCHSYICPQRKRCLCAKLKGVFPDHLFDDKAWDKPPLLNKTGKSFNNGMS